MINMKTAKIVVGSCYGDEGKGLMVDYLSNISPNRGETLVIRYNGGAQAGHTVVTPEGKRHVFGHLGAGTLAGVATYLGPAFITNPLLFNEEYERLPPSTTMVYPQARMTLPSDMLTNQLIENHRTSRHGSCGVGIFETVRRYRHGTTPSILSFAKMTYHELKSAMDDAKEYSRKRLAELGVQLSSGEEMLFDICAADRFQRSLDTMSSRVLYPEISALKHFKHLIFEGAQGLLLNERYGEMPYLTPSNPGATSPIVMCKSLDVKMADIIYTTRAYLTRHGNGPMPNESTASVLGIINNAAETNTTNQYQGELRYAPLNRIASDAAKDDYFSTERHKADGMSVISLKKKVAITCLDQVPELRAQFVEQIFDSYGATDGYLSFGPTRNTVSQYTRN